MTGFSLTTSVAAAAVAVAFALPAAAAPFEVSQQGSNVFGGNGNLGTTVTWTGGTTGTTAGGFALSATELGGDFVAWCLDIGHTLDLPGDYSITTTPFAHSTIPGTTLAALQKLVNTAYTSVLAGLGNSAISAGFQLALWEILDETSGSYDVKTGSTTVSNGASSAVVLAANGFLANLEGPQTGNYKLTYLQSEEGRVGQSLVTISPVPVPAAGLLLFGALGGLGMVARRRKSTDA